MIRIWNIAKKIRLIDGTNAWRRNINRSKPLSIVEKTYLDRWNKSLKEQLNNKQVKDIILRNKFSLNIPQQIEIGIVHLFKSIAY